jgi:hypothetical protein
MLIESLSFEAVVPSTQLKTFPLSLNQDMSDMSKWRLKVDKASSESLALIFIKSVVQPP